MDRPTANNLQQFGSQNFTSVMRLLSACCGLLLLHSLGQRLKKWPWQQH